MRLNLSEIYPNNSTSTYNKYTTISMHSEALQSEYFNKSTNGSNILKVSPMHRCSVTFEISDILYYKYCKE